MYIVRLKTLKGISRKFIIDKIVKFKVYMVIIQYEEYETIKCTGLKKIVVYMVCFSYWK